jgi:hypothetical protein
MAIARITGPMLQTDLERQGVNLSIDGNLVYADVSNRRVGIGNTSPQYTLDVNGNAHIGNLWVLGNTISSDTGKVNLGSVTNLVITGGQPDYILTTDGAGNPTWANISALQANVGVDGTSIILGTPTDGSLTANAAYDGWSSTTTLTNAIDNLNQVALNLGQGTFVGNVQFTANSTSGASPKTILFTGTASGNPNAYYWDFGDGNTTTGSSSVSHTYANVSGGTFTVYYRASNSSGTWSGNAASGAIGSVDDFTRTNYVVLYTPNPIPSFTSNATSLNTGGAVLLTDSSQYETDYSVYWGDGTKTISSTAGGTQKHTYTNAAGDATYSIILQANSTTAGPSNVSVNSASTTTKVYSTHTPLFSANTTRVVNWESNGGGLVRYTNSTTSAPGSAATFGAQQVYQYWWSDSTANTNVAIGVGTTGSGDTSQYLDHTYALSTANQAAGTTITYDTQLRIFNGHTTSPFSSTNVSVIVEPSVRSNITARANVVSDATGDNGLSGYIFTDYNGYDRALFTYNTAAQNSTVYNWGWGDGTASGNITTGVGTTSANITYAYASTGTKTANLTVYGTPGTIAQSNSKSVTITIKSNPTAPGNLSAKTLSMSSASQGTAPYMAVGTTDNTAGNIASAGTAVTRYISTTPLVSGTVTQANSSTSGTLTAVINGTGDGNVAFSTSTNASGTYTSLIVDADADARSAISGTYPTGFYKVFSAHTNKALTGFGLGYNDINLNHSAAGKTNNVGFVKDDVTGIPVVVTSGVTVSNVSATTIRYISSIPYYQAGGNIVVQGLQAYSWIGQTYQNTTTPVTMWANTTLAEGRSGTLYANVTRTYAQIDGATTFLSGGIPKANTGNVITNSYTFGNLYINGIGDTSVAAVGNANVTISSVNGVNTSVSLPKFLNVYSSALSGFDETSIACSSSLGGTYTDVAKRIKISGATGDNPTYSNSTNYYTTYAWTGSQTIAATDEAVVRWGNLKVNTTNYSTSYLPSGPDLATGRTTTQYFRFAFRRTNVANFDIAITGKISGLYVAAPGTQIDTTSTLNGWIDANVQYAGSGIPGADTGAGGNGGNGCALTTADKVPTGVLINGTAYTLTLGSENLSNAYGNQCLLNIKLGPNDYITALSIGVAT